MGEMGKSLKRTLVITMEKEVFPLADHSSTCLFINFWSSTCFQLGHHSIEPEVVMLGHRCSCDLRHASGSQRTYWKCEEKDHLCPRSSCARFGHCTCSNRLSFLKERSACRVNQQRYLNDKKRWSLDSSENAAWCASILWFESILLCFQLQLPAKVHPGIQQVNGTNMWVLVTHKETWVEFWAPGFSMSQP